ncbi:hypothetical protein TPAU25S_03339 [Tsukamurella paurometabola]
MVVGGPIARGPGQCDRVRLLRWSGGRNRRGGNRIRRCRGGDRGIGRDRRGPGGGGGMALAVADLRRRDRRLRDRRVAGSARQCARHCVARRCPAGCGGMVARRQLLLGGVGLHRARHLPRGCRRSGRAAVGGPRRLGGRRPRRCRVAHALDAVAPLSVCRVSAGSGAASPGGLRGAARPRRRPRGRGDRGRVVRRHLHRCGDAHDGGRCGHRRPALGCGAHRRLRHRADRGPARGRADARRRLPGRVPHRGRGARRGGGTRGGGGPGAAAGATATSAQP